jgi:membrane associated rhomboid family serine protease
MPTITTSLLALNIAVFALQTFLGEAVIAHFALWPIGRFFYPGLGTTVGFEPWQLLTYSFLHANNLHLALNMFALYTFGREVERMLGGRFYLGLYLAAVLCAAGMQLAVVTMALDKGAYPTVGASGGVFGILLAFGMLFPHRRIVPLFPPIPMPARYFVFFYGLIELASGVLGTLEGVAHFAHLGGMLGGYGVLKFWRKRNPPNLPRPESA